MRNGMDAASVLGAAFVCWVAWKIFEGVIGSVPV